jgi:uncharacterized protein HemY
VPENVEKLSSEESKMINENMINLFIEATKINQNDPELYTSLSVLFFIKRDYEGAVRFFKEALK